MSLCGHHSKRFPESSSLSCLRTTMFLPEEPSVAVRSGSFDTKVELLAGVTSDEGANMLAWKEPKPEMLAEQLDDVDRETLKNALFEAASMWLKDVPTSLLEDDLIGGTNKSAIRRKFVDYLSNRRFVCPMHSAAAAHASLGATVYTYVFDQWPAKLARRSWAGVGHGTDQPYIFGLPMLDTDRVNFSDQDVAASEKLITMIGSFAGLPVYPGAAAWPMYSASSPISMLLKNSNSTNINGFHPESCGFSGTYS